jgi:hypothetical protein
MLLSCVRFGATEASSGRALNYGGVSRRRIQQIAVSSGGQIHRRTLEMLWN